MASLLNAIDDSVLYSTITYLDSIFSSQEWIFAKTMPDNPHWYTLRRKWNDDPLFDQAVSLIRKCGYRKKFGKTWYTQININEHFYWTMGAAIDKTILINRAKIDKDESALYDDIAEQYDSWFLDPESFAENAHVSRMLRQNLTASGTILDVGCGTGLALDLIDNNYLYTGIDPSQKMLAKLKRKFPLITQLQQSLWEDFTGHGFDNIISLFGSFSYVKPTTASRVLSKLNPGGKYFIMLFQDSYFPITHRLAGWDKLVNSTVVDFVNALPGCAIEEYKNYVILTGGKDA